MLELAVLLHEVNVQVDLQAGVTGDAGEVVLDVRDLASEGQRRSSGLTIVEFSGGRPANRARIARR